jgi:putative ABC transport system permease protein
VIQPRWRKVLSDLWSNKTRTLLVVLSIGVGVFAVGLVSSMANIYIPDMDTRYAATNPHGAAIYTDSFGDDLIHTVEKVPGVAQATGRSQLSARVEGKPGVWSNVTLVAIPPLNEIKMDRIDSDDSPQAPGDHELFIERGSTSLFSGHIGDSVRIELADKTIKELKIAGYVHDMAAPPTLFTNGAYVYVNPTTLAWLGGSYDPTTLYLTVSENQHDEAHVKDVAHLVAQKIEKSGRTIYATVVFHPGEHPDRFIVESLMVVLTFMSVLLVFLSAFLVVNTINALLGQHIRQIGMMKAIGARTDQIIGMYFVFVLALGAIAALISIPPAALLGYRLSTNMAHMLNFDLLGFRIPTEMLILQIAIAFSVPLLASIYPVLHGTHITVREAISSYGLGQVEFGKSVIDRFVAAVGRVLLFSRPLMISLRNTIRRKARLALTLSTLTLSGAIFIGVLNLSASFDVTIQQTLGYFLSDVNISLNRMYRTAQIDELAKQVPGVTRVEAWGFQTGQLLSDDKQTSIDVVFAAPPAGSTLIKPVMTAGRWLIPGDENAVVIGNHVIAKRPDLKVGDDIVIKINTKEYTWHVVGIYQMAGNTSIPIIYTNNDYLAPILGLVGRSNSFRVAISPNDPASQARAAGQLQTVLENAGIQVGDVTTGAEELAVQSQSINILVYFLAVMAIMIALVGGIGLMGTMSMNVLERTREIGVMRSIGASDGAILRLVLVEGLMIGIISWVLGSLLAAPLAKLMDDAVGVAFVTQPLTFTFSYMGLVVWLVIVLVLSALASILPAVNAVRLTVRDVLAYE